VGTTLYGTPPSHPSHAARLMLERKGIDHRIVWMTPGLWPILLRTRGFRGGTVPALKLDGKRIQHSRAISRALEEAKPEPHIFPNDPEKRLAVEEAERWGEEVLQPVPRRIIRWMAVHRYDARVMIARDAKVPLPRFASRANAPMARYLAHKADATDKRVESTIRLLPALIEHVDGLIREGDIGGREPNAADFQIGTSVASLMTIGDVRPAIEGHPAAQLAERIIPDFPGHFPPGLLPAEWLAPLRG
jgi:glutathione S-transferase